MTPHGCPGEGACSKSECRAGGCVVARQAVEDECDEVMGNWHDCKEAHRGLTVALDEFFEDWSTMQRQGGWSPGHLVARLKAATGR